MTQEVFPHIDESVPNALGRSQDEINRVIDKRRKDSDPLVPYLIRLKSQGIALYDHFKFQGPNASRLTVELDSGEVRSYSGGFTKHIFPSEMTQWSKTLETKYSGDEKAQEKFLLGIKAVLEGFGRRALSTDDWNVAIDALDKSTEGGIMENKDALEKFRVLSRKDIGTATSIALALQEKINERVSQDKRSTS